MNRISDFIHRELEKWGKIFKTDLTYLAKSSFWLGIGQAFSTLASVALTITFANVLPKEVYGDYRYILSLAGLLSVFTVAGLGDAVMRASAQGHDGTIFTATRERIKFALLGAVVGCGVALYYYLRGNIILSSSMLLVALALPVFDTFTLFIPYLQGKENFKLSTWYNLATHLISTAIMIGVVFLSHGHVQWIVLAYFGSYSLFRYLYYRKVVRKIPKDASRDTASITYGRHISVINILGMVAGQIDNLLVFGRIGSAQLATYSISISAPTQLKGPLGNLDTIVTSRFAKREASEIVSDMNRKILIMLALNIFITVVFIIAVPFVFSVVFPKYHDAIPYSQIYALCLPVGALLPVSSFLTAHRKVKQLYSNEIFYSIARILGAFIGIISGGLWGLIIARVIVAYIGNIFTYSLYRGVLRTMRANGEIA